MNELMLRFPHIPEQIFEELDFKNLTNLRLVSKSWKQFIDEREHRWYPFKNMIVLLKPKSTENLFRDVTNPFHLACMMGQAGLAEIIMKNSAKLNIVLNGNIPNHGHTVFHFACITGNAKIAEMIMKNSVKYDFDLNAKDNSGFTAYHYACMMGKTSVVDMMINNYESVKIDFTIKDSQIVHGYALHCNGETYSSTGFKLAQLHRRTDVVNLIRTKMQNCKIAF